MEDEYSEEILADLLANALRRAQEGKDDDAVARLYRAVEMIGQMLLLQQGINTSAVRLEQLPSSWQTSYQGSPEPLKLGQEKDFLLLESLGHPVGKRYCENKNLRNYLSKRNSSVLAHGIEPMSREVFQELNKETHDLALMAFPDLSLLENKSCFPNIELL